MAGFDQSWLMIIRLILVVIAGTGTVKREAADRIQAELYPAKAPLYAHVQVDQLRQFLNGDKQLLKKVHGEKSAKESAAAANKELARLLGVTSEKLQKQLKALRGIGFWYLTLSPDEECQRLLLVADFGPKSDITGLLADARQGRTRLIKDTYAGHAFIELKFSRHFSIWCSEKDGLVSVGTDPLVVKRFILQCKKKKPMTLKIPAKQLVRLRSEGEAFWNAVIPLIEGHDRSEFFTATPIFDPVAAESLDATLTANGLKVTVNIAADSNFAKQLAPTEKPSVLAQVLPQSGAQGFVFAPKDPAELYTTTFNRLQQAFPRENDFSRFEQTLTREMALDVRKEILPQLKAGGILSFAPLTSNDLDDKVILVFEVKDAAKARKAFDRMVNHMAARNGMSSEVIKGGIYAEDSRRGRLKVGICNTVFAITGARKVTAKEFRSVLEAKVSADKAKRQKGTVAAGVLDLSGSLPGKHKPITAAVKWSDKDLVLTSDLQLKDLLLPFLSNGKGDNLLPVQSKRLIVQNARNLKQIGTACMMYATDNGGKFPPSLKALAAGGYLKPMRLYIDPGTGDRKLSYIYCPKLTTKVANPAAVIVAAEPKPYNKLRAAVFVDGHVQRLQETRFQQIAKHQGWVPGAGLIVKQIPKAKREAIRKLCRQLGSTEFKVRSAAKKKLKALGAQARPILKEFTEHKDPEVRMTVKELLQAR